MLVQPHPHGGCRCSQVLITPREALTLGRDWCASSTSRRRAVGDVHASRRVAAAALSHARGDFLHHPQAVRTRTRTEGRRQKSPCRFGDVYSNRSGFSLPTPNTLTGRAVFDTSARERVTAHLRLRERVGWFCRYHVHAADDDRFKPSTLCRIWCFIGTATTGASLVHCKLYWLALCAAP